MREVLRAIIDKRVQAWMEELFGEMTACPLDEKLWSDAARLAWRLDRRGSVLPVPDLAIASCALLAGAVVVFRDPHFHQVPGLSMLESLPAVGLLPVTCRDRSALLLRAPGAHADSLLLARRQARVSAPTGGRSGPLP